MAGVYPSQGTFPTGPQPVAVSPGEPIVNSPEDALRCLMGAEIEFLVGGNSIMRKEDRDIALKPDYKMLMRSTN